MEKLEAMESSLEPTLVHTWQGARAAGDRTPQSLLNLFALDGWARKNEGQSLISESRWHTVPCVAWTWPPVAVASSLPQPHLLWDGPVWLLCSPVLAHLAVGLRSVCVAAGTEHCGLLNQFGSPLGQ